MNEDQLQLPRQTGTRQTLRHVGLIILGVDAVLTVIGIRKA